MMFNAQDIQSSANTMAQSGAYKNWQEIYAELNGEPAMDIAALALIFSNSVYQRFIDNMCSCAISRGGSEMPPQLPEDEPESDGFSSPTAH